MYRKTTSRNAHAPLYRLCSYCGRNDHKVAVRLPKQSRPYGTASEHPTTGICPSCLASKLERSPFWPATVGGTVVYDRRGRKTPPLFNLPLGNHAVFATTPDLVTFRVTPPTTWPKAIEVWEALDDRRRQGDLTGVKFVEVREASESDPRYRDAESDPSLVS